jgi:hypothetical protein
MKKEEKQSRWVKSKTRETDVAWTRLRLLSHNFKMGDSDVSEIIEKTG